ncbi:MAG: DUF3037 domain-containing protein [Luteolibacter sp.]
MRTYDFATIGFRPFAETQEFVTMGVVALDTAARQFDFVLQDARKTGRVLAMFPKAGKTLYREARATLETELESIRKAVNEQGEGGNVPLFPVFREKESGLFAAITSPREGVFCYPVKGRRMAADMEDVLTALKARFIDQDGLTAQQAVEQAMARALRKVLSDAKILPAYKRDVKIGPEEFQVTFAFAHLKGDHMADRALRPLNFDLATSTDIYNHGDEWINKMRRLRLLGYRPDRCLIAAREPSDETGHRGEAFRQIRDELMNDGFVWTGEHETGKVIEFARLPEGPVLKLA